MPRLALLFTLCVLLLAAAAVLFRGDREPELGPAIDAPATRAQAAERAELALLAPRAEAPREVRTLQGGTGIVSLQAAVRYEGGAAVPDVPVQIIGATWTSARTDEEGLARFDLAAGEVEVLVPARDGCDFVPRYAPDGLSNVVVELRPGEEREVELLVYRGSTLEVDLCNVAGTPLAGRRVNLHRRERAGWSEAEPYTTDERGRVDLLGLGAGSYLLEQGRASTLWFPPYRVDLVSGERRRAALVAEPRREVSFRVRAVRAESGELLPLQFDARLFPRARADEPVPPDYKIPRRGWAQRDRHVSARVHARRYEVELQARGVIGDQSQLVTPTVSSAMIDVGPDGVVEPPEIEVAVTDVGPLAVVRGRIETELEHWDLDVCAQLTRSNGKSEQLWTYPVPPELRFVLVVDLDLLLHRRVEFFQQFDDAFVSVGAIELGAGEQALTLQVQPR